MLLLESTDHVSIIDSHTLNKVLVMSLGSGLTLHTVIDLFFQGVIISGEHLNTVITTLILKPEFVNKLLLCASHSILLSDTISVLLILRFDSL